MWNKKDKQIKIEFIKHLFNSERQELNAVDIMKKMDISLSEYVGVFIKNSDKVYDIRDDIKIKELNDSDHICLIHRSSPEGEDVIKHSMAHILAQAVQRIFKKTEISVGPTTENGFFYDIYSIDEINNGHFSQITAKMHEIIDADYKIEKKYLNYEKTIEFFKELEEYEKVKIIEKLIKKEADYEGKFSLYSQEEFTDLCRGPHVYSTSVVQKGFLINEIVNLHSHKTETKHCYRIYGIASSSPEKLKTKIKEIEEQKRREEELKKRDHRIIGHKMGLFVLHSHYAGSVLWNFNGFILYNTLKEYIRHKLDNNGYKEVQTPILYSNALWKESGHWQKYKENMFLIYDDKVEEGNENSKDEPFHLAMKPMSCPAHIMLFKSELRSYKDLPMRIAEFGCCHRNEPSGALNGLMRVRGFTQDDAHIFCTPDQIEEEAIKFCALIREVYEELGLPEIEVFLSDRPDQRLGTDDNWDIAEKGLANALEKVNMPYTLNKGEGAFYGPKIEFSFHDALGRTWQLGTLQLDFVLPERMDAYYIDQNSKKKTVVVLHRAMLGSIERFIAIILENTAGKLPIWMCPVQIAIININDKVLDYCHEISRILKENKVKFTCFFEGDTLSKKIQIAHDRLIPLQFIIGEKEKENRTVCIRQGKEQKIINIEEIPNYSKANVLFKE